MKLSYIYNYSYIFIRFIEIWKKTELLKAKLTYKIVRNCVLSLIYSPKNPSKFWSEEFFYKN